MKIKRVVWTVLPLPEFGAGLDRAYVSVGEGSLDNDTPTLYPVQTGYLVMAARIEVACLDSTAEQPRI